MTEINDGSGAGLLEFLDFLVDKRYGSKAAVMPWKSAVRQVMSIVDGEDFSSIDVKTIDIDEYLDRFENGARGQYKAESVRAYRSRFTKAAGAYLAYLGDGTIPTFRAGSSAGKPRRPESASNDESSRQGTLPQPPAQSSPALVDYPFPLRSGQLAQIRLPAQLEKGDAERIAAFVRTLVFEPQLELESGKRRATEDEVK